MSYYEIIRQQEACHIFMDIDHYLKKYQVAHTIVDGPATVRFIKDLVEKKILKLLNARDDFQSCDLKFFKSINSDYTFFETVLLADFMPKTTHFWHPVSVKLWSFFEFQSSFTETAV